ncbi:exonuclease SbcCD subunit D [Vibrio sp.]|uniref:Nuclease SbcCD subunit D n=1 Tax=Vibrio viridaestus TaxID=2487322 RepID=A0A3N9TD47_9VIBR|nr:exonuclease SbcCD subunit D [Vibrio viridaestus]MDC0611002.1 exonuclease SbcCD subunit D [Vibrio sp.]RQW62091.1 exonuclease SbcCD subunit D [Vibrio viridaestus]
MKFIHTSDWHLGRQFHNISLVDDQRQVLSQLINYIKTEKVDALVIAGDIYDRAVPPTSAIELLNETVQSICGECGIPLICIPGNHDSAVRLGFASNQMEASGLHILSSAQDFNAPVRITDEAGETTCFYGIPYLDPETARDKLNHPFKTHDDIYSFLGEQLREAISTGENNVLIAHCFVDGADESDSERPLSIGGADRVNFQHLTGFDYVALGHLHQPQFRGIETIRYSGSLLKYSFSEQHQNKSVTLVELKAGEPAQLTKLPLTSSHDVRVIEGYLDDIIQTGMTDANAQDYIMVRLLDSHAILEPMEKLRSVYPNVLHLEKPGMLRELDAPLTKPNAAHNEMDMFADFFSQIQGEELSDEQRQVVKTVIEDLGRNEETKA